MMEATHLELRILSVLRSRDAYLKYSSIIKDKMFESKIARNIYKLLVFYHKKAKSKTLAPLSSLFALVNSRMKENEAGKYIEMIRRIKKYPLHDEAIADTIIKQFSKKQLVKILIGDALTAIESEEDLDVNRLRAHLDEALLIDSTEILETAYDYMDNASHRLEQDRNEPRIASGLNHEIDAAMRGGLAAGELGIIVAPTKVGKSMILLNIAYNAMRKGKKILYITLELSARRVMGRFDQRVTRKNVEYLEKHPALVNRAIRKLDALGAGLRIKDCTAAKLSPNELDVYLERLRKTFEFDLIIVDMIDLMYTSKEYKERRHELSAILIGLRRLGSKYVVPVWTASQAGRQAGAAGNTSMWDIAEDIGKVNWADIIITLSQSPEDKEENIMFMEMEGNRIYHGNPKVTLKINYPIMKVSSLLQDLKEKKNGKT